VANVAFTSGEILKSQQDLTHKATGRFRKLNHYRLIAGRMLCGGLNRRLKENAPKGGGFYHGPPSAD
jgi:hypothetical protein